jgi:hypothetical protein
MKRIIPILLSKSSVFVNNEIFYVNKRLMSSGFNKPMKKFQRKKENFECENCDENIKGNGYTNHCPKCLYSKHVDINPGDRLETCHGLMIPVDLIKRKKKLSIIHQCLKCKIEKPNKVSPNDNLNLFQEKEYIDLLGDDDYSEF